MITQSQRMKSRFNDILSFRKTHTLQETGDEFKLSQERVRQILLSKNQKRCKVHNRLYYNRCSHCLVEIYEKMLSWMKYDDLIQEATKQSKNKKRDYLSVQRRIYLIKILRNKYKRSFGFISTVLNKDVSTINHLYAKGT